MTRAKWIAACAAVQMICAAPVAAQSAGEEAAQLRRLDIMLMVSNLRCRRMGDNFDAEYERFAASNQAEMNVAARTLSAEYAPGGSTRQRARALDTLSTQMANRYGAGHPWMDCADLREAARSLAGGERHELLAAASQLLGDQPPARFALASR